MLHHALLTLLVTTSQPVVDSDVDGIPDVAENLLAIDPEGDHDSDGIANYVDVDDRGDGSVGDCVPSAEGGICLRPSFEFDLDGDQLPNHLDFDSDDDGYYDAEEGMVDTDHDANPDFLDVNSDGDTYADVDDLCRTVISSGRDADQDGIGDECEPSTNPPPAPQAGDDNEGIDHDGEPTDDGIEPGDEDEIDNLAGGVGGCNAGGRGGASWLVLAAIGAMVLRRRAKP